MPKKIIVVFFIALCSIAYSQKNNINIGLAVGLPTGTYNQGLSYAYEPSVVFEFAKSKQSIISTASISYMSYKGKNGIQVVGGLIPILAGIKPKIAKNTFAHIQAGASVTTENRTVVFSFSPSLGYQVSSKIDASIKYFAAMQNRITESYLGLRVGYSF